GITTSLLAGSIGGTKVANGAVTTDKLAANSVASNQIANGGIQLVDLAQNDCIDTQTMAYYSGIGWSCANDVPTVVSAGPGITVNGYDLSARTGSGLRVTADMIEANFLPVNSGTASGGAGSATTVSRSDHNHDDTYVKASDSPGNGVNGDVTGSYSAGFKVTGLQGIPIFNTTPQNNQILSYNGSQWAPTDYGFPFEIDLTSVANSGREDAVGQVWATCPATDRLLVTGGCQCGGSGAERTMERAYPVGQYTWFCDCMNGGATAAGNEAFAMCIKNSYP
ncbi:MAG: hypothetical protein HC875_24390, partial [Anaerolineales bacterium]|nr:hypothetical protein [Anaerolineales bacterium]